MAFKVFNYNGLGTKVYDQTYTVRYVEFIQPFTLGSVNCVALYYTNNLIKINFIW